jgi:hypothetical protein
MSDHHNARDASVRHTYRHTLGHALHVDNSGAMQWGAAYRDLHRAAWAEAYRVLCADGVFVLNIKNHIRAGKMQDVTDWHIATLCEVGFQLCEHVHVDCPGQRHGKNGAQRVAFESVIMFRSIP